MASMEGHGQVAYKVRTDSFEGPFDLLLYLVSKKKVDIGAIPIAQIADQYLAEVEAMKRMDLETASDFLVVAATLLEIKAASLLPKPADGLMEELEELTASEAYVVLVERLIEYKKFKNASEELYARYISQGRMHPRIAGIPQEFADIMPDFLEGVTPDALGLVAAEALARHETALLDADHIAKKPIPVEMHAKAIFRRLANSGKAKFSELVPKGATPEIVVVSFLAILELYKRRTILIEQRQAFGDIDIFPIEGVTEESLEGIGADS